MKIRLATCTALAMFVLLCPRAASAGCHFWSFADINIDSDKDISGEPNGRPLVRFYLVCHDSLVDHQTLNPDLAGGELRSIPVNVPLMVAAHGGNGNLLSIMIGNDLTAMESTYLMIIPASGGHTFPRVLSTAGGPAGSGNEIRDFSVAQEACIWFGDGCIRAVGY